MLISSQSISSVCQGGMVSHPALFGTISPKRKLLKFKSKQDIGCELAITVLFFRNKH
jgi:hypothetical protein